MPAHLYGAQHNRARQALLADLIDGDHCPRCTRPMWTWQLLEADHLTRPALLYPGALPDTLSHRTCNRTAGWMLRDIVKQHGKRWARANVATINTAISAKICNDLGMPSPRPRTSRAW